jgi:hypothetical protein
VSLNIAMHCIDVMEDSVAEEESDVVLCYGFLISAYKKQFNIFLIHASITWKATCFTFSCDSGVQLSAGRLEHIKCTLEPSPART